MIYFYLFLSYLDSKKRQVYKQETTLILKSFFLENQFPSRKNYIVKTNVFKQFKNPEKKLKKNRVFS